ncbi:nucleotide kinase [Lithospermum erythrorhizon]|uniref:1-phosphatidylinositol 4-kinase n=1 Tax=Lithospermum erythrorhizon TaxID=34254 RepID=A0AAV3PGQ3_LITER
MAVVIGQNHGFKPFVRRPSRCRLQSQSQQFHYNYFSMLDLYLQDNDHFGYSLEHSIQKSSNNNLHRSVSTPCLSPSFKLSEGCSDNGRQKVEIIGGNGSSQARALVVEAAISLASGLSPEPVSSGLGGAYFLRSRNGARIAVVKPMDEEPLALNNPKGFAGGMLGQPGMKRSIKVGETCLRELAAYLLDDDGFSGVAPTALVRISHPAFHVNDDSWERTTHPPCKIASLQRFADHDCDSGELGSSGFSIASVHRIGILDVRTLNLDRHAGNMLVKRGEKDGSCTVGGAELVPIDHGFCLPDSLDDPYFEWLHWPQASVPFSPTEMEYISKLEPFKDAEILKSELPYISESSIRVLVVCTMFLKQAAVSGLCLADIGEMMTREFCGGGQEERSELESICMKAKKTLRNRLMDGEVSAIPQVLNGSKVSFNIQLTDVSQTLQNSPSMGKPPKIPRFSSVDSVRGLDVPESININSEKNLIVNDYDEDDKAERASFAAFEGHGHRGDDLEGVTFGELSDYNWELFLEIFGEMLVEALEGRKCMCMSKLGSCEF